MNVGEVSSATVVAVCTVAELCVPINVGVGRAVVVSPRVNARYASVKIFFIIKMVLELFVEVGRVGGGLPECVGRAACYEQSVPVSHLSAKILIKNNSHCG
jgi:hypothetical protein